MFGLVSVDWLVGVEPFSVGCSSIGPLEGKTRRILIQSNLDLSNSDISNSAKLDVFN